MAPHKIEGKERAEGEEMERQVDSIIRKSMEDLIGEIARSFEYYTSQTEGATIGEAVLSGGTSCLKSIDKFFSEELGIPVSIISPFRNLIYEPKKFQSSYLAQVGPLFTVGLGLALRRPPRL